MLPQAFSVKNKDTTTDCCLARRLLVACRLEIWFKMDIKNFGPVGLKYSKENFKFKF